MRVLQEMEDTAELEIRFVAMLSARDETLCREWIASGPDRDTDSMFRTFTVKAFQDGALGSRGARLLDDYSDRPGERGTSGGEYGFDESLVEEMMTAGFQAAIHAIGDGGNRQTLDYIEGVLERHPGARGLRHRIEHAQVVHPDDFGRFAELGIIASMQPQHSIEDKTWAEERVGPERIRGAYAWRTLRMTGTQLLFNSDLPGSDHSIWYGLHSAMTRKDPGQQPPGGWYPEQVMTPEEAVRGFTRWAAISAFVEDRTGILRPGYWADITVVDTDPLQVGGEAPERLLDGEVLMTIVGGRIVFER